MQINKKKITLEMTEDEAILFLEYLADEKMDVLLPILDNNYNLLMIFARIICEIEKNLTCFFDPNYDKIVEEAKQNLIEEFGDYNALN
jgi:hypothetical protein